MVTWQLLELVAATWATALIVRGVGCRRELGQPIRVRAEARSRTYGAGRPRGFHQLRSPQSGRPAQHHVPHPRDARPGDVLSRQGGQAA